MKTKSKVITWISVIVIVALAVFVFFRFFFVYSSGVNAGTLNYFQKQGVVFKTYEGKIIQSGFKAKAESGTMQSNEWKFSVANEAVADELMKCSGKQVELHWKRHFGTLPWRGSSQYIVDDVVSVSE